MHAPALPDGHAHRPVLVGYSGGLDSTALLHLLASGKAFRRSGLRAIHVHHGLQADADAWATHCRSTCDALGVELKVARVEVDVGAGTGPEAAARRARHAAFANAMRDGEVLALAHHRDDQAETFLLRALRASGPDGLAAMRPWRAHAGGWLWRPLLETPREALLAFAREHGLSWIEDPSNSSTEPDRNFLRHRVIPLLRERWPHADASFSRSAALHAETIDLLDADDRRDLANVRTLDPRVLSATALLALPPARRARVLRRWIAELSLPPLPAEGVSRIETHLLPDEAGSEASFEWSGCMVRRWRDLLHADMQRQPLPEGWQARWDGTDSLVLPTGDTLAFHPTLPAAPESWFVVHARRGGERIALPNRDHSHALKHVLQDMGVPPWERERLPLLSGYGGELLAAGDLAYSASFDEWLRARGVRVVWARA